VRVVLERCFEAEVEKEKEEEKRRRRRPEVISQTYIGQAERVVKEGEGKERRQSGEEHHFQRIPPAVVALEGSIDRLRRK
jgi:hypothetical protein